MSGERKPRARKRLRGAPTHVAQLPLRPTPRMRSVIDTRFYGGLRVYNACLGEALRRDRALRADPRFEEAKALPKGKPESPQGLARYQAFDAIDCAHGFTESAIMSFGSWLRQSWVRDQVLCQEAQTLARRAFLAAERWHYGKGGKPRFKAQRRGIHSLECKDGCGSLKVKFTKDNLTGLQWGRGFVVPFAQPKSHDEQAELDRITGLVAAGKLISCRITRAKVRGRWAYRAQFVLDGPPPVRHSVGTEQVSIDMGPSTVHVVSQTTAQHCQLAPGVAYAAKALRRAQRKLDRQHRKGSPSCFDAQRRHKSGRCDWNERSHNAQRTQVLVGELHRVLLARRDTEHGQLANQLIGLGPALRAEKLNYVAWQKRFPKSVRDRAPGSFVAKLRYKAESAGGGLYEYDPRTTALSQTCICARQAKKPLSERTHRCPCGVVADRDLFSAFLGFFVKPKDGIDTLDAGEANAAYSTRHDLGGALASRNAAGAAKQQVHRRSPSGRRSVVRIAKRLNRRSDRAARPKLVQPLPTATAA